MEKKRIIFIDDEPNILEGLRRNLRRKNDKWEMNFFNSGNQAIEFISQIQPPDLIVCDIMMPEMDGYKVLNKLREDPKTAIVPFIFLTGKGKKNDIREGMDLGADDFLTKPFTAVELSSAISARLKKKVATDHYSEEKLNQLRKNIVFTMPHELRTPLTGIICNTDLIIDCFDMLESNDIIELSQGIRKSSIRLGRLIENYLIYAQIEVISSDKEKIEALKRFHTYEIGGILKDISKQKAKDFGREKDLNLEIENSSICISEEYFIKIIRELLDNAFKFSNHGTPVEVKSTVQDEFCTLSITDYGVGFKNNQINEIGAYMQFERENLEQQGSGMGLIIAKRLTELHGGKLAIESSSNIKTIVRVSLITKIIV